ncbi:ATP-binding protein [Candidatus Woesearchaeota archaeon]|nr:ATP-binding protein [Candidatus Woesearchaeota archaeon]
MKTDLKQLVQEIVDQACSLKNKHTSEINAPVNYACVFSQSDKEYQKLLESACNMGELVKETPTGPLFHIEPLDTVSGELLLLKIRLPDKTRPERGDADFTVSNYPEFKRKHLPQDDFKLIQRENFEMIELVDEGFDVRAYFSNPPLDEQLNLGKKMKRTVISGGTYAGKTSLIESFKKNGFEVVPDVGFEVIKELNAELSQDGQKEFRTNHPIEFYTRIIRKQLEIEKSFGDKTVIYDRGVHDYIAMLRLAGTIIPDSLMSLVSGIFYDLVFVCDALPDFDERKSSGRSLTKDDSLRLKDLITETYQNLGCRVIQVKEMSLDQRYKFIRNRLNSSDFHEIQQ